MPPSGPKSKAVPASSAPAFPLSAPQPSNSIVTAPAAPPTTPPPAAAPTMSSTKSTKPNRAAVVATMPTAPSLTLRTRSRCRRTINGSRRLMIRGGTRFRCLLRRPPRRGAGGRVMMIVRRGRWVSRRRWILMCQTFERCEGIGVYADVWLSILYVYTGMYIRGMIVLRSGWKSRTGVSVRLLFEVLGSVVHIFLWVLVSEFLSWNFIMRAIELFTTKETRIVNVLIQIPLVPVIETSTQCCKLCTRRSSISCI